MAIDSYKKSIDLYQKQNQDDINWMYLDTYAWLGQAYEKKDQNDLAVNTYKKSLEVEKDFNWVKEALLPAASK